MIGALSSAGAISTINDQNTDFAVAAGGFAGSTNPAYAYTVADSGAERGQPRRHQRPDRQPGLRLVPGSAFLLDADDTASFDFAAKYVVLNFDHVPSIEESAALFELVGEIDPELFETDTSGYTQFGRAYLSLKSAVPDRQFINGYIQAAEEAGVEYTPIVKGKPSLFEGGAAFPFNDWSASPSGEDYLARIPAASPRHWRRIRDANLQFTRDALAKVEASGNPEGLVRAMSRLKCR